MAEEYCNCDEFEKALEEDSGSDAYGSAINLMNNGSYLIGVTQTPVKFCPWCGKKVPERKEQNE